MAMLITRGHVKYIYIYIIPSGKRLQKTMERSTIFHGKTHYKWQFSIAVITSKHEETQHPRVGYLTDIIIYKLPTRYYGKQKSFIIFSQMFNGKIHYK